MMPWVYLDDHFDEHPKIVDAYELDHQAPLLYIAALAYCRRHNTGGRVPDTIVRGLMGYRPKAYRALIIEELWKKVGPGQAIQIHDFFQWNKRAESRSASARNAARIRWSKEQNGEGDTDA